MKEKFKCSLCEAYSMNYIEYKGTHIWICEDCPNVELEYYEDKDLENLKECLQDTIYVCTYNNYNSNFNRDENNTIENWRKIAIDVCKTNNNIDCMQYLMKVDRNSVMDFISYYWNLQFERI